MSFTTRNVRYGAPSLYPNLFHAVMGIYVLLLLILLFWIYPQIFLGYTLASLSVLFFDALFVFLVFPLSGSFLLKTVFAFFGHMIGLGWVYFLSFIDVNLTHSYGSGFHGLYVLVSPFLEMLWVVSMWAVGLSILASMKRS